MKKHATLSAPLHAPRSTPLTWLSFAALGFALLAAAPTARAASYTITVDASKQTAGNPHFWSASFGTGKAKLTLRSDLQSHYKIASRELGAVRVRGHGLLNDEMALYKGAGSYDWKNLDTYLAAIVAANMRPIVELSFMPKALGSNGEKSPPKDYNEWKNFIKGLVQHMIDKYGMDDVSKWYFEVWNEPDYPGFWDNSDMTAYYTLYDNTVDALTAVIPNVLVGGPATTEPGKIKAFLQHCKSANKRVTFVSSHVYPGGDSKGTVADAANLVNDNNTRISGITGAGYSTADIKSFNTEWSSSYSGQGGGTGDTVTAMDNHWNIGFILKGVKLMSDKNSGDTPPLEVFSYWAISDVFDESGGPDGSYIAGQNNGNLPFGAVFGAMTYQGIRKAAFNAFKMLNLLGPKRLQSAGGTGSDGVDAMATKSANDDEVQILVYNYHKTLNTTGSDSVTVNVSNLPSALAGKEIFVTQFLADETHSNPYSVWVKQGKPGTPSETQWQEMRKAQHLALAQAVAKKTVDTTFSASFTLNRQAGTLILLSLKRPVTGRNALVELEAEDYDGQDKATKGDSGDSSLGQAITAASGSYIFFENVDYSDDGVASVDLRVKAAADTSLELRAESASGTSLGKCTITSTSNAWATQTCALSQTVTGVAKLYVTFGGAMQLNWLKFKAGGSAPGSGGAGGTGAGGSGGAVGGAGGSSTGVGGASGGTTGTTAKGGAGGNASGGAGGSAQGGSGGSAQGGSGGGAGGSAQGGAAGNASGGSAGSASGGSGGSAQGGSGGNAQGGSGGNASGGSGGSSGSGGATATDNNSASGCACRVADGSSPAGPLLLVGLVAITLGLGRSRTRRCR